MSLLKGKTILITKSKAEAEKSIRQLEELGAEIIYFPDYKSITISQFSRIE